MLVQESLAIKPPTVGAKGFLPRLLAIVVTAATALAIGLPDDGVAQAKTTITCAASSTGYQWLMPFRRPSRCMVFEHNEAIHAYEIDLHRLHWRGWGGGLTKASAINVYVG